jgi:GTP-binding protein EngB required for normal cell division
MVSAAIVPTLLDLTKELQLTVSAFAKRWGPARPEVTDICVEAVRQLRWIETRWSVNRFNAAFVGLSKVGKSTLLNATFGQEVTPRRATPMTQVPIEFTYAPQYSVTILFRRSFHRVARSCADAEELRRLLEQYATEGGQHATADVKKVEAGIPAEILANGLIIADTPGFGAAQINDQAGTHNRALIDYLPKAHQIFWVILFEQGITQAEASFYEKYLRGLCDDVVVTGCDDVTEADKARYHKWAEEQLGLSFMRFHFVSGKKALQAKLRNDQTGVEGAGIAALEQRLKLMGSPDTRQPALLQDLALLCADFGAWVKDREWGANPWPTVEWKRLIFVARNFRVELDGSPELMSDILQEYLV